MIILIIFNVGYSEQYLISIKDHILAERSLLFSGCKALAMNKTNHIWDAQNGYGLVSRCLHWLMAVLFA